MPNTVESLLDIKENGDGMLWRATGLFHGFHEAHRLMRRGVRGTKTELLADHSMEPLKVISLSPLD